MRLVHWAGLAVACCVALEVGTRLEDFIRYDTPWLVPYAHQRDLAVRDRTGMHGRPYAQFQKWKLNALGLRGPGADSVRVPGSLRILTLGASETFGIHESPGREYPRQLQDTLQARWAAGGCGITRIEVLNGAFPGMTLPTLEQDFRNRLRFFDPDVVTYYPSPVFYLDDSLPAAARPDSGGGHRLRWTAYLRSRAARRLATRLKELEPELVVGWLFEGQIAMQRRTHGAGWRFDTIPPDRLAAFEGDLRRFVGTVRSTRADPVFLTHIHAFLPGRPPDPALLSRWVRLHPRATPATILAFEEAARRVTLAVAADSGVRVVDLWSDATFLRPAVFADQTHFTDLGSGRVARLLADALAGEPALAHCRVRK